MPDVSALLSWVRRGTELFAHALTPEVQAANSDLVAEVTDRVWATAIALGAEPPASGQGPVEEYATAATALTDQLGARADWSDPITVDGAELTATQVLWPLAQQLTVGAVDLGGAQFAELPTDFLTALLATIIEQRAEDGSSALEVLVQDTGEGWLLKGVGEPVRVMAPLVAITAWLASRPVPGGTVKVLGPQMLPELPRWG